MANMDTVCSAVDVQMTLTSTGYFGLTRSQARISRLVGAKLLLKASEAVAPKARPLATAALVANLESIRPLPLNGADSVYRPFLRPPRYPWALHIAGCVWQSGQLRLLAGKPPKTPFWSRCRHCGHRRPDERWREVSMHVGLVMECDYRDGRTQEEAFA